MIEMVVCVDKVLNKNIIKIIAYWISAYLQETDSKEGKECGGDTGWKRGGKQSQSTGQRESFSYDPGDERTTKNLSYLRLLYLYTYEIFSCPNIQKALKVVAKLFEQ